MTKELVKGAFKIQLCAVNTRNSGWKPRRLQKWLKDGSAYVFPVTGYLETTPCKKKDTRPSIPLKDRLTAT